MRIMHLVNLLYFLGLIDNHRFTVFTVSKTSVKVNVVCRQRELVTTMAQLDEEWVRDHFRSFYFEINNIKIYHISIVFNPFWNSL